MFFQKNSSLCIISHMTIQLPQILEHLTTMVHMTKLQERHDSLNDDVTVPLEDHVNDKDKTKTESWVGGK